MHRKFPLFALVQAADVLDLPPPTPSADKETTP